MKRVLLSMMALAIMTGCVTTGQFSTTTMVADPLEIGDVAPPLQVTDWVKGSAAELPVDGDIVVLEFWATWCGPCVESIPHLTEIQSKYADRGVTIVGVTAHDDGNTLKMVRRFVKKRGDKIGYRIAFDKDKKTYDDYMTAAGEDAIPTAFVVDRLGRVAWIGHPMGGLDEALAEILSGKHDVVLAAKSHELGKNMNQAWRDSDWEQALRIAGEQAALKPQDCSPWMMKFSVYDTQLNQPAQALAAANKAVDLASDHPDQLSSIARRLARRKDPHGYNKLAFYAIASAVELAPDDGEVRATQYRVLAALGRNGQAQTAAEHAVELLTNNPTALASFAVQLGSPDADGRCHDLALRAVEIAISAQPDEPTHLQTKFRILAICKADIPAAKIAGGYFVETAAEDADILNDFAWNLLTNEDFGHKFNELAMAAAEKSHRSSGGENWMYLDTYALAKFETGDLDAAITLEKQAIELSPKPAPAALKQALQRFESAKKRD